MIHPYGMKPSDVDLIMASSKASSIQSKVPQTTCSHRGDCCRAGCPNMYYCEYLKVVDDAICTMSDGKKIEIILECIRRYLKPQVVDDPKPCLFLEKHECGSGCPRTCDMSGKPTCVIYHVRPLKCRLYGLIPEGLYRRNAAAVAREMSVPKEKVPLCEQCDQVKGRRMGETEIAGMESDLRVADRILGMPEKTQEDGFGFLTFHDWHLMTQLGTGWMEKMTILRTGLKEDEKERFVLSLKAELERGR